MTYLQVYILHKKKLFKWQNNLKKMHKINKMLLIVFKMLRTVQSHLKTENAGTSFAVFSCLEILLQWLHLQFMHIHTEIHQTSIEQLIKMETYVDRKTLLQLITLMLTFITQPPWIFPSVFVLKIAQLLTVLEYWQLYNAK